jgi:hypothetical protein
MGSMSVRFAVAAVLAALGSACSVAQAQATASRLTAVACPTASQCTAIDNSGHEVTFNPRSAGRHPRHQIDFTRYLVLKAIACPSAHECVAVNGVGAEIAFNPSSPDHPKAVKVDPNQPDNYGQPGLTSIACPTVSQCTAVDDRGDFVTFDPATPEHYNENSIDGPGDAYTPPPSLPSLACTSVRQCIAVDTYGNALIWNPRTSGLKLGTNSSFGGVVRAIACPGVDQCTGVSDTRALTFDPAITNKSTAFVKIDGPAAIAAIACPTLTQCTVVDADGSEVTFDPAPPKPGDAVPAALAAATSLTSVACPSASRCVAVGAGGDEITFDPDAPAGAAVTVIDRPPR